MAINKEIPVYLTMRRRISQSLFRSYDRVKERDTLI
jgi:hypothetical protein